MKGKTMSHKAAKAIRKTIRAGGTDVREVVIKTGAPLAKNINWALFSYGRRTLASNCGRKLYQNTKYLHRSGAFA